LPPSSVAARKGRVISPQRRSLLLVHCSLLGVAAIWGGTIPAIKYMLRTLEPIDILLIRVGGAALIFALILSLQGKRAIPKTRRDGIELLLFGMLGIALMNMAMITGQDMIPAALASLIVTSNPVFTALVSRFLTGEPLTRRKIGGIALAFAGFLIVLLSGSGSSTPIDADQIKGILIVAIAPFSWAFYTVLTKPYLTRYQPANVAGYTAIGGFLGALPVLLFTDGTAERLGELGTTGWAIGFYLSAFGFVVAYVLWYRALRVLTASQTAVYIYLVPVFGILCAWLFLDEEITSYLLLGGAVILAGVVLTNSGRQGPPRAPEPVKPTPLYLPDGARAKGD
jgi:drug/metabolite transporter (DMT)-like permease